MRPFVRVLATLLVAVPLLPAQGAPVSNSDDVVWYVDYTRGFLGRLDPKDGVITEMPMPGGPASLPYGMATDDKDRLWFAETGTKPNRLIGYVVGGRR